jgi:hypothetical protein
MLKRKIRMSTASAAGAVLLALSACSVLSGGGNSGDGDSSADGFTDITDQVGSWDMCKVLSPESVYEQTNASGYVFDPSHIGLGSASNAEAISCSAMLESPLSDKDRTVSYDVLLSVFPGNSTEHVDDMWEIRQGGFLEETVENNSRGLSSEDLLIDKDIEGPWVQGHAYALFGTEGETAGQPGSMIVNVRTDNYMVEFYMHLPDDPAKTQAVRYGLTPEEIDTKTSLTFDRIEFANWVVDEHINEMFEAVVSALENDSEVQR